MNENSSRPVVAQHTHVLTEGPTRPSKAPENLLDSRDVAESVRRAEALQFLRAMGAGLDPERHRLALWRKNMRLALAAPDDEGLLTLVDLAMREAPVRDVYVRTTSLSSRFKPERFERGTAEQSTALLAASADVDFGEEGHVSQKYPPTHDAALDLVTSAVPVPPSTVILSGHGLHLWWFLDKPWEFSDAADRDHAATLVRNFQDQMRSAFRCEGYDLDATADLARVLRLPGTMNHKRGVVPVSIEEINVSRYTIHELFQSTCLFPAAAGSKRRVGVDEPIDERLPDTVKLLLVNDSEFEAVWTRHSPVGDGSASAYDLSIASRMAHVEADDDDIVAALKAHRALHGNDVSKIDRPDYVSSTLGRARTGSQRIVDSSHPTSDGDHRILLGADGLPLTDVGNGERLARSYGGKILFVSGEWLVWDGKRWRRDVTGGVDRLAVRCVRQMRKDLDRADPTTADQTAKASARSESDNKIKAMLSRASKHADLVAEFDAFDTDPWLLNVGNGIVDLRTCVLRPHDPADRMTVLAPASYNPEATARRFDDFMSEIFNGDSDLVAYVQRAIGYSLTGMTNERKLFVLLGAGANGKSVFLETMRHVFGDYAQAAVPDLLLSNRSSAHPTDIARLRGARFMTMVETPRNARFDEARLKQITGGDRLTAHFMHRDNFEFTPQLTPWMACNSLPAIDGADQAVWDRIEVIEFTRRFDPADDTTDRRLLQKLRQEVDGILSWAIQGCRDWQQHGLGRPGSVIEASELYRQSMDVVSRWLAARCDLVEGASTTAAGLYTDYGTWCRTQALIPMSETAFGARLHGQGFQRHRASGEGRPTSYRGLRLQYDDSPMTGA